MCKKYILDKFLYQEFFIGVNVKVHEDLELSMWI